MKYCKKFTKCFWHGFFHDHSACVPVCERQGDLSTAAEAAKHCDECFCFVDSDAVFDRLKAVFWYGQL